MFGTLLLSHYDDCFELLRLAGTSVDDRNATQCLPLPTARGHRRPHGRSRRAAFDPGPRPARSHPPAPAGVERVHRPPGRAAPGTGAGAGGRPPRRGGRCGRRGRSRRPDRPLRVPAAVHGDQRAAGHAGGQPRRAARLVAHDDSVARALPRRRHRPDGRRRRRQHGSPRRRGHRVEAAPSGRRPAERDDRRRGRRRPHDRRGAPDPGHPALPRRPRDHRQPHRQRHAGAAAQPRPVRAAGRRSGPRRPGGRGAPALRQPRPAVPPHRHDRDRGGRRDGRARAR